MFSTNFDEIRKFWYGDYNLLEYKPKISLGQALLNSMRVFGSKLAQVNEKKSKITHSIFKNYHRNFHIIR